MTRFIKLTALKGGQGTSTTAVLLANKFVQEGKQVLIVQGESGDIDGLCGATTLSNGKLIEVCPNLAIGQTPIHADNVWGFDVVISDDVDIDASEQETYLVTQPCYLALRKYSLAGESITQQINGVIIVRPEGRVLSDTDIANVVGAPIVAVINMNADVARASDAGLLTRNNKHATGLSVASV